MYRASKEGAYRDFARCDAPRRFWEDRKQEQSFNLNRQQGFTLLEMIVGIAIFAILAAIAVPNFVSLMPKYRLNGAARQVMSDLMSARMRAISLNRRVKIFYLSDNHRYKIGDDANGDGTVADGEGDVRIKDIQTDYYDVTLSSNNDPLFDPRGTAANLATITLTNSSGSKGITISTSGGVKIN